MRYLIPAACLACLALLSASVVVAMAVCIISPVRLSE